MNFLIAPDSFKESLTSLEACIAIEKGFRKVFPSASYIKIPIADGGEGSLTSVIDANQGSYISLAVKNPLGTPIKSRYGLFHDKQTAFIEMADSSGLSTVSHSKRNPLFLNTHGVGEAIQHALNKGCREIIIGVGGSATHDCGIGALHALGVRFLDHNRKELKPIAQYLAEIDFIDTSKIDSRLHDCHLIVACDVTNPLLGDRGAAYTYAKQKGASEQQQHDLEKGSTHFVEICQKQFDRNINVPFSGAAGGLAAGLLGVANAELKAGFDVIATLVRLEEKIQQASLVITGEGGINYQSLEGKTPIGVAKLAKKYHLPVIAFAGNLGKDYKKTLDAGIDAVFSIVEGPRKLETCMKQAPSLLEDSAFNVAKTLHLGENL